MFRLKELRLENGLKRSEFAKKINLPATTIANYENETRQAPYNLLIEFAAFFNVTVDYLLGYEEDAPDGINKNDLKANILTSQEKQLLTLYRQCSETGKNRITETAALWKNVAEKEK